MPAWNEINNEIDSLSAADAHDIVRKKYLKLLADKTGRPTIGYYSGFLWKRDKEGRFHAECAISDLDMNGFMAVIHGLPKDKGLDLILHTPGGGIEAARGIVEYLYKIFGKDLQVIVPHMAMSAGTMIACAAQKVFLGKHSCLGPTDPQIRGYAAMGILAEVDRAMEEMKKDPMKQILWNQVFAKYPPAFISDCERSVEGARAMVKEWLEKNMLSGQPDPAAAAELVMSKLMDYSGTTEHSHHFLIDKCIEIGLTVEAIEADQETQERILSVHHCYMASFARSNAIKIIDNSDGQTWSVDGSI
ncbi:SDH family Clp fold serine proteinase [Bradyrhizobium oligotrophicum]|uniref:SDH family Clp fold serine proteinase n=1 Tax=Bradyrhizobium oligotrophicum TaxID=44255 RepID=UPI003EBE8608